MFNGTSTQNFLVKQCHQRITIEINLSDLKSQKKKKISSKVKIMQFFKFIGGGGGGGGSGKVHIILLYSLLPTLKRILPNSPLSIVISKSAYDSQNFRQNVYKNVINYAVVLKNISKQHATVLH